MHNILVVEDEKSLATAMTLALEDQGYGIETAENGFEALSLLREKKFDLILTDLRMPRMDGIELVSSLQKWNELIPVIVLTAFATIDSTARLFKAGIRDLLVKPFELKALYKAVSRILEETAMATKASESGIALQPLKPDMIPFMMNTVQALFATIEARDENLSAHSARVACYVLLLAKKIGLSEDELRDIEFLALLHDIGKLALPETVLLKRVRLSESEEEMAKIHPVMGENIVRPLKAFANLDEIIRHHHEWFNGQGYPDGLAGEAIPLFSRIIAIADVFDNKLTQTVYDTAAQKKVLEQLRQEAGKRLDPNLLETFISTYQAVVLKKSA
jgi:putative two-component system response regulator